MPGAPDRRAGDAALPHAGERPAAATPGARRWKGPGRRRRGAGAPGVFHPLSSPPFQILENFKIETMRAVEVGTKFDLILIPDKPIYLTLRPLEPRA